MRTLGRLTSVARNSRERNDVSTEAGESSLLISVTRKRLVKANLDLVCIDLKVWKSTIVLQLFVVTTCKWSINLFINPNPVYSHTSKS
jgi:hypothetical protein